MKSNPNFELLFSLLCPEPEKTLAEWDIEEATSDYFNSMMLKLKPILISMWAHKFYIIPK